MHVSNNQSSIPEGRALTYILVLPPGVPRHSSSGEVGKEISARWKKMTEDEKDEATRDLVKDLEGEKEMKALAVHSVPISAFHDVRASMDKVYEEVTISVYHSVFRRHVDFSRTSSVGFTRELVSRSPWSRSARHALNSFR